MGTGALIQLAVFIAIVWFLLIVPQRKEQKRHREMVSSLKPGDEVVTVGGLVGEIIQIRDEQITLKSGDSRVVVERAKISRMTSDPAPRT